MNVGLVGIGERPTVCDYWGTICISFPLACVFFVLLAPFVYIFDKIGQLLNGGPHCPFGKIKMSDEP